MMTRSFLALVGLAYIVLAAWCTLAPAKTSKAVGFSLAGPGGQSEFLTVYGGLELALGIVFLWPLFRPEATVFSLFVCLVLHACLVLFRAAGFVLYSGFPATTYYLAATEWGIFLGCFGVFMLRK